MSRVLEINPVSTISLLSSDLLLKWFGKYFRLGLFVIILFSRLISLLFYFSSFAFLPVKPGTTSQQIEKKFFEKKISIESVLHNRRWFINCIIMYSKKSFNSLIYHINKRRESSSQGCDSVKDPPSVVVEVGVKSDRVVALWSCKTQQEPLWTIRWWLILYQTSPNLRLTVGVILSR